MFSWVVILSSNTLKYKQARMGKKGKKSIGERDIEMDEQEKMRAGKKFMIKPDKDCVCSIAQSDSLRPLGL